jgi:putative ubiquitin-RnfH superfamily antitoxin RatB of RatAB toxin-antitoxin module
MTRNDVSISVVYALADRQQLVKLIVEKGLTVAQAVERSGLAAGLEEGATLNCAIFSRLVPLSQVVVDGDRIEILRPLLVDPKENRRQVAAQVRTGVARRGKPKPP